MDSFHLPSLNGRALQSDKKSSVEPLLSINYAQRDWLLSSCDVCAEYFESLSGSNEKQI